MNKKELMLNIGEKVKEVRLDRGLTQEQLAEKADIGAAFVARVEAGQKMLSIPALQRVAAALNISCDYLINGTSITSRMGNLSLLLNDKSDAYLSAIEKIVQICSHNFVCKSDLADK